MSHASGSDASVTTWSFRRSVATALVIVPRRLDVSPRSNAARSVGTMIVIASGVRWSGPR